MNNKLMLEKKFRVMKLVLDEQQLRLWSATEAKAIGHGGIGLVSNITGLSEKTISRGIAEISSPGRKKKQEFTKSGARKVRKSGGGRKSITETDPELIVELEKMISPYTRGDPESALRWTSKSMDKLARELTAMGHPVSAMTVYTLLTNMKYSLQSNKKTKEGDSHKDRDAQFQFINKTAEEFHEKNFPVISIDTKKKELIGEFKNNGQEWEPAGKPVEVNGHDFIDENLGKVAPYGIYDVFRNEGFVNVGISADTAEFAVESIRRWWLEMGKQIYSDTNEIFITADCGGSNSSRSRLWKSELQDFADETDLKITVSHFPPGTSKWNKIEHRLFSFISQNWRGKPLISREVVVNLIGSTKTKTGLSVTAVLDENSYEKAIKIEDNIMNGLSLIRNEFHGEWNYVIQPKNL